jgi:hypothetical protein
VRPVQQRCPPCCSHFILWGFATLCLLSSVQQHNQQAACHSRSLVPVTPGLHSPTVPVSVFTNRYDQEHDRSFFTFRDPLDSMPPSRAETQQRAEDGKRRVRQKFYLPWGCP